MNYTIRHHIIFPLPANDNCGLNATPGLVDGREPLYTEVKIPGPSQSAFMRIFAAVRAEIERGCYE